MRKCTENDSGQNLNFMRKCTENDKVGVITPFHRGDANLNHREMVPK